MVQACFRLTTFVLHHSLYEQFQRGTQRSQFDPPIVNAVPQITYKEYSRKERDKARRRLRMEDCHNVTDLKFEEGEIVFILHGNVSEADYKLPLSVARVTKVLGEGEEADVTYLWGTFWRGTFKAAELPRKKLAGGKLGPRRFWTDTIDKEGVLLMRGSLTRSHKISGKTLEYLKDIQQAKFSEFEMNTCRKGGSGSKKAKKRCGSEVRPRQQHANGSSDSEGSSGDTQSSTGNSDESDASSEEAHTLRRSGLRSQDAGTVARR